MKTSDLKPGMSVEIKRTRDGEYADDAMVLDLGWVDRTTRWARETKFRKVAGESGVAVARKATWRTPDNQPVWIPDVVRPQQLQPAGTSEAKRAASRKAREERDARWAAAWKAGEARAAELTEALGAKEHSVRYDLRTGQYVMSGSTMKALLERLGVEVDR